MKIENMCTRIENKLKTYAIFQHTENRTESLILIGHWTAVGKLFEDDRQVSGKGRPYGVLVEPENCMVIAIFQRCFPGFHTLSCQEIGKVGRNEMKLVYRMQLPRRLLISAGGSDYDDEKSFLRIAWGGRLGNTWRALLCWHYQLLIL